MYVGPTSHLTDTPGQISRRSAVSWRSWSAKRRLLEVFVHAFRTGLLSKSDSELGLDSENGDCHGVNQLRNLWRTRQGRLGVIGPIRMDYARAITAVEEVGDGLG